MEEKTIEVIKTLCTDLMKFIKKNVNTFFLTEYEPASEAYLKKAGA